VPATASLFLHLGRPEHVARQIEGTPLREIARDLQAPHDVRQIADCAKRALPDAACLLEPDLIGEPDQRRVDLELQQGCAGSGAAVSRRPAVDHDRRQPACGGGFCDQRARDACADDHHIDFDGRELLLDGDRNLAIGRPNRRARAQVALLRD